MGVGSLPYMRMGTDILWNMEKHKIVRKSQIFHSHFPIHYNISAAN